MGGRTEYNSQQCFQYKPTTLWAVMKAIKGFNIILEFIMTSVPTTYDVSSFYTYMYDCNCNLIKW